MSMTITWDQGISLASSSFSILQTENVSVTNAIGRYVKENVVSLCDLPAFETSSMDGWAVSGDGPWKLIGEVATGKASSQIVHYGQCLAIATGGVIPAGTTSVIPWEKASEKNGLVIGEIEDGANIRPAGMESKTGDILVTPGTRITPPMAGLFAATGLDSIQVISQPRVAIFFLGDELIHTGVPVDGAIRDALGPLLPSVLNGMGAVVTSAKFVKDDLSVLNSEIAMVLDSVDLIVTTGGTADGPRDFVKLAMNNLAASMVFDCVKVRPGYHVLLARVQHGDREIPFLALPGNPQSALAALYSFGKPLIASLLGAVQLQLEEIELSTSLTTPEGFSRLVPGTLDGKIFTPSGYLGSAMLRGVAHAQGFALINPGLNPAGAIARWIPFNF
jgi:molybdopterin molybdotransferase